MYGATHCALATCSSYEDDVHQEYDHTTSSSYTPDTQAALATVGSTKKYLLDDTSTC